MKRKLIIDFQLKVKRVNPTALTQVMWASEDRQTYFSFEHTIYVLNNINDYKKETFKSL